MKMKLNLENLAAVPKNQFNTQWNKPKKIDFTNKKNKHILFLGRLDPNKGLIQLISCKV